MGKTINQILKDVKAGKIAPVYLFTGEENYFIDTLSDYFENNIVPEENRDFDQLVCYGRDTNMLNVIGAAQQMPMMSERRLVLVKEAQDLGGIPNKVKSEYELLVPYLQQPNLSSVIVFCFRHKPFDKRTKAYKSIDTTGVTFEHKKLYDSEVPGMVLQLVSQAGFGISEKAATLIAAYLGSNLSRINNELSKLYISMKPGEVISEALIERNIGISKDFNVFELQAAIGKRDVAMCMRIVNYFAANPKDNPIQLILPNLYNYFIKVMLYIQNTSLPPDDLVRVVGVPKYFLRDYAIAAHNYTLGKLATCIGYLYDADQRSKGIRNSGTITEGEILKEMVFKITH